MILQVLADAGQVGDHRDADARGDARRARSPDSMRSCGELMLPPHRITSREASASADCPRRTYSTPTARRPSTRMRHVSAW